MIRGLHTYRPTPCTRTSGALIGRCRGETKGYCRAGVAVCSDDAIDSPIFAWIPTVIYLKDDAGLIIVNGETSSRDALSATSLHLGLTKATGRLEVI